MKRLRKVFFSLIGAILVCMPTLLSAAPVGANSYYGGNGRLTFYSPVTLNDNTQEVYTVKPDGTDFQRVTDNSIPDANPQWNPAASKIAYDSRPDGTQLHDIYVQNMNSDGTPNGSPSVVSGADEASIEEFDPSWSPNGNTIAYHRGVDGGDFDIWTVPAIGGSATQRTDGGSGVVDTEPTWNKDGDMLTFTRKTGSAKYIMTVSATASSASGNILYTFATANTAGGSPQWSPTSNTVAFTVDGDLMVQGVNDSSPTLLASGVGNRAPTWSPDGKIIAMSGTAGITYYSATTGALLKTVTIATNAGLDFDAGNGIHELDWARATMPPSTTHECTTKVNTDCTNFTPSIPAQCQDIITAASHGTPKYESGAFKYTPNHNYVGDDTYVYRYFDENMNSITCTVTIHVLPLAPNSGAPSSNKLGLYSAVGVAVFASWIVIKRRVKR